MLARLWLEGLHSMADEAAGIGQAGLKGLDTVGNARDDYCEILRDRNAKKMPRKHLQLYVIFFCTGGLEAKTNTTLHPCILCLTSSLRVSAKISFDFDSGPQEI